MEEDPGGYNHEQRKNHCGVSSDSVLERSQSADEAIPVEVKRSQNKSASTKEEDDDD